MTMFSMSAWPIVLIFLGAILLSAALTVLLSASIRRRHLTANSPVSASSDPLPCKKPVSDAGGTENAAARAAFSPVTDSSSITIFPAEPVSASSAVPEQRPTDASVSPVPEAEPVPEVAAAESPNPAEEAIPQDNSVIVEREDRF